MGHPEVGCTNLSVSPAFAYPESMSVSPQAHSPTLYVFLVSSALPSVWSISQVSDACL